MAFSLILKVHNHHTTTRAVSISTTGISPSYGWLARKEAPSDSTLMGATFFTRAIKKKTKGRRNNEEEEKDDETSKWRRLLEKWGLLKQKKKFIGDDWRDCTRTGKRREINTCLVRIQTRHVRGAFVSLYLKSTNKIRTCGKWWHVSKMVMKASHARRNMKGKKRVPLVPC